MYLRPETAEPLAALWALIRDALRARGVAAPDGLSKADPATLWLQRRLVLGQACGLPLATWLAGRVRYVGTLVHRIEDCPPGFYRSAVIVSQLSAWESVADALAARPAINAPDSQSGHAALRGAGLGHRQAPVVTGSHAASIAAVANGRADIAAIDAVTWALAERHDPAAARVRVVGWTPPAPALPLITAPAQDPEVIHAAVSNAVAALGRRERDALMLDGVMRHEPRAYAGLGRRAAEAGVDVAAFGPAWPQARAACGFSG